MGQSRDNISYADNLSIQEVIIASLRKPNHKETILEFLDYDEVNYYVLQAHFDPTVNYLFPATIIDGIMSNFDDFNIIDKGTYVESSAAMFGADPAAYPPDGSWCADLYEFLDHFKWIEPEGQEFGFFTDLNSAKRFGDLNWMP
jgi:hypothetical protein